MTRLPLSVLEVTPAGIDPHPTAANTDGHQVVAQPGLVAIVRNGSGGSIDVTVPTPATVKGLAIADRLVPVPAGATRAVDLSGAEYLQADGLVYINYSAITTVTVGVIVNRVL